MFSILATADELLPEKLSVLFVRLADEVEGPSVTRCLTLPSTLYSISFSDFEFYYLTPPMTPPADILPTLNMFFLYYGLSLF